MHIVGLDHYHRVALSQSGHNFQFSTQIGTVSRLISATGPVYRGIGDHSEAELEPGSRPCAGMSRHA